MVPRKGATTGGPAGTGCGEWKDFITFLILSLSSLTLPWTMPVLLTREQSSSPRKRQVPRFSVVRRSRACLIL